MLSVCCMQVCKHKFSFTPVYAKDAPSTLPWHELLLGLLKRAARGIKVAHRVSRSGFNKSVQACSVHVDLSQASSWVSLHPPTIPSTLWVVLNVIRKTWRPN